MNYYTHNNTHEGSQSGQNRPTARFHAEVHRATVEDELTTLAPDGDVAMVITASDDRDLNVYALEMPQDRAEHEGYWYAISSQLHDDQARAAAFTFTAVVGDGQEMVCVLASDRDGGEEAWTARLIRSATEPPRIVSWVRGEPGGTLMFMLHAGVCNVAGLNELAHNRGGVPPAFRSLLGPKPPAAQ